MTKKIDQQKPDKATRAMLSTGTLPKDYKQPDKPTPGEGDEQFKMNVDRKGRGKVVEVKD